MSKVELAASAPYRAWLRRERRGRLAVRGAQVAILVVSLVLWEVLPKAQIINPFLTSYPSALWPTFLDLLKETPQQPSILSHTFATVLATVIGFAVNVSVGAGTVPNTVDLSCQPSPPPAAISHPAGLPPPEAPTQTPTNPCSGISGLVVQRAPEQAEIS